MTNGYLVTEEFIIPSDEREWGYPDYSFVYPIAMYESEEDAQKFVDEKMQIFADKYMDFLDENKEYLESGAMTSADYWDDDEPDRYSITKIPYYRSASSKEVYYEPKTINRKNVVKVMECENGDGIVVDKAMKFIK